MSNPNALLLQSLMKPMISRELVFFWYSLFELLSTTSIRSWFFFLSQKFRTAQGLSLLVIALGTELWFLRGKEVWRFSPCKNCSFAQKKARYFFPVRVQDEDIFPISGGFSFERSLCRIIFLAIVEMFFLLGLQEFFSKSYNSIP